MEFYKLKNVALTISLGLILFSFGCSGSESKGDSKTKTDTKVSPAPTEKTSTEKKRIPNFVDVPTLANRSARDFDKIYGQPVKITPIKNNPAMMPGEYREYRVNGHPKNLSVRFYKDQAKRFNLILGTPVKSSKQAISRIFKVDVKGTAPDKSSEPLSEKWRGRFSGLDFVTLYAKREKAGGGFTMVHAEIVK